MPATLLHGPTLPVTVPPIDHRLQRRPIPPEFSVFDRDESSIGKAMMRLAKEIFRPDPGLAEREEQFKRRLAAAVNQTAQAAFTPMTTISRLTAMQAISATGYVDLMGLEQVVVVPVPARAHLILNLHVRAHVVGGASLNVQVTGGPATGCFMTALAPVGLPVPFIWSLTAQELFDLEPETAYTFQPQAEVSAAGSTYRILDTLSTFTVRVEPRSLIEE